MKALLLLHLGQLVFFPHNNIFKNSREISVELNDLEHAEEKLIVSFFPGQNNESTSRLESPGEFTRQSSSSSWRELLLFLLHNCCIFILRKIKYFNPLNLCRIYFKKKELI